MKQSKAPSNQWSNSKQIDFVSFAFRAYLYFIYCKYASIKTSF